MRIGVDARLIGQTGVGRYIRNLLEQLGQTDTENEYVVYLGADSYDSFVPSNTRWRKQRTDVHWHTAGEQLVMPRLFSRDRLDIVHVPYFNMPILYGGKFVVTIHDLTVLHFATGKATTRSPMLYLGRRIGYRIIMEAGLRRAQHIIAVSETTKQEIAEHFPFARDKIRVTYEGVDEALLQQIRDEKSAVLDVPYVLYVGNVYPHKNIDRLFQAFETVQPDIGGKLVLVGNDDIFYRRLKALDPDRRLFLFYGPADDRELATLYRHARCLVFPSLMEGFGLPALEAVLLGCPVMCSDIAIFREILGDIPTYVNPASVSAIAGGIVNAVRHSQKPPPAVRKRLAVKYSWKTLAEKTRVVYEESAKA